MRNMIFILIVFTVSCSVESTQNTQHKGQPIPSFNLLLADSTTYFNTHNITSGGPIVLLYVRPNCPYSRAQIEDITKNIKLLEGIRFYIFTATSFGEMKQFSNLYSLNKYPNIVVGLDYDRFFSTYFETVGVPYMAIYGKNKLLNDVHLGNISSRKIRKISGV